MTSIFSSGSPRRRRTSASHASRVTPGSSRQSRVACATEGITLTFGGSPTPERSVVSEIVECWIAFVYLFRASVPTVLPQLLQHGHRRRWARLREQARQRPDQSVVGVPVVRLRAVPRHPLRGHAQPQIFFSATAMP